MNILKNYMFFNNQYKGLSKNQLMFQYQKDKKNPSIICSFKEFKEKYPHFDIDFYKNAYDDLKNKNNKELIQHWIHFGVFNNYISSKYDFYNKYPQFNINEYQEKKHLKNKNENEILFHYLNIGKYEYYQIKQKNNIIIQNKTHQIVKYKKEIKKIAHVFVHFFKIGGGEIFLTQLINYFKQKYPELHHTLFLNKYYSKNEKYIINIEIKYYDNYDQLFELLDDYDIIYDNQLYFFTDINPFPFKTLSIIHGCSVVKQKIKNNQILHSIHLYSEKNIHNSWNFTIKKINYLGVQSMQKNIQEKINSKLLLFTENYQEKIVWNIGILGRIDSHKIPPSFLELLMKQSNNIFIFNIYGCIDSNYEIYFLDKIKKIKNIIYHGVVEHENIHEVYLHNEIILSPSNDEAGGTILLEAMNHCCLVIARNAGGNNETIQSENFLVNNEEDYIDLLNKAINMDYNEWCFHLFYQKINVLLKHNQEKQCKQLIDYSKNIIQNVNQIPNYVHYIFGLKKQTEDFSFLFYLSIYSNILINKPDIIYFHYHYIPKGYWWNKIKDYLTLNFVPFIDFKLKNNIKIEHYAHKSDYLRLLILEKYGGIYFDIDSFSIKNYSDLLKHDCVIGVQEKYKNENDLFGNAVIFSKPNHFYIQDWLNQYEFEFNNEEWTGSSLFLPTKIYNNYNETQKKKIHVVKSTYFYYPNYNEEHLLFHQNQNIHEDSFVFHCCQNYLNSYINHFNINCFDIIENLNDCLFHQYVKNIINNSVIEYDDDDDDDDFTEIEKMKNDFNDILKSSKQENVSVLLNVQNYKLFLKNIDSIHCLFKYNIYFYIYLSKKEQEQEQINIKIIEEFKKVHNVFFYLIISDDNLEEHDKINFIQYMHVSNKIIKMNENNIQCVKLQNNDNKYNLLNLLKVNSIYKV